MGSGVSLVRYRPHKYLERSGLQFKSVLDIARALLKTLDLLCPDLCVRPDDKRSAEDTLETFVEILCQP